MKQAQVKTKAYYKSLSVYGFEIKLRKYLLRPLKALIKLKTLPGVARFSFQRSEFNSILQQTVKTTIACMAL